MAAEENFAHFLARLLDEKSTTANGLANALKIDASVVYKWRKNQAVPKLDSQYREMIADHFELDDDQRAEFEQAHVLSLKTPRARSTRRNEPQNNGSEAEEELHPPAEAYKESGLMEAAIALLEHLPALPTEKEAATIRLTFQGQNAFEKNQTLHGRWLAVCAAALEKGWSLQHLWRLDGNHSDTNRQRAVHLIEDSLKLLGTNRYFPGYFNQPGLLSPPYDVLIVPGHTALMLLASGNSDVVDAAAVIRYPAWVAQLEGHFQQLAAHTTPLCRTYKLNDIKEREHFWNDLDVAEERPGARLLAKQSGLSSLTRPDSWYKPGSPWLAASQRAGNDEALTIRHFERRKAAFEQQIAEYDYLEMWPMKAIETLVQDRVYPRDTALGFDYQAQSPEEVRDHLRNAVDMLKKYDHYKAALLDDQEEERILVQPFWEVTGDESVLIQTFFSNPEREEKLDLGIKITEPSIVGAFQNYFQGLWRESINRQHRDKDWVIWWLEREISNIR